MGDRYLLKPICEVCGEPLDDYDDMPLFMSLEDNIVLKCPECGAKTKFWFEIKHKSKIVKKL